MSSPQSCDNYNVRLAIWFLFLLHYLPTTSLHNISFHVVLSYNNRSYYVCDTNFLDNELRFIFLDLFVNSICIKHSFFPNLVGFYIFQKVTTIFSCLPKKIFTLQTMTPLQSTFISYALMMVFVGNARLQQIWTNVKRCSSSFETLHICFKPISWLLVVVRCTYWCHFSND